MGVNLDHGQCPLVKAVWVRREQGGGMDIWFPQVKSHYEGMSVWEELTLLGGSRAKEERPSLPLPLPMLEVSG